MPKHSYCSPNKKSFTFRHYIINRWLIIIKSSFYHNIRSMSFPNTVNTHVTVFWLLFFFFFVDLLWSVSFSWRFFMYYSGGKMPIEYLEARSTCGWFCLFHDIVSLCWSQLKFFMKNLWFIGAPRSTLTLPFCHKSTHLYNRIIFHKSLKCNAIVLKCYGDIHKALNKTSSKFNNEKWRTRQRFSRL